MGRLVPLRRIRRTAQLFVRSRWLLPCLALGWTAAALGAGPQRPMVRSGFQVESSTAQSIRLSVRVPGAEWSPVPQESVGLTRYDLALPGFTTAGGPGAPRVPGLSSWIVLPAGMRADLKVVSERWADADGRLLAVDPVPTVSAGKGAEPGQVGEITVLPGELIPEDVVVPAGARAAFESSRRRARQPGLKLGQERWWRGRRVVPVELNVVRLGAAAQVQALLETGTWEIVFSPDKSVAPPKAGHARKRSSRGDDHFTAGFLNPEMLRGQPTEAAFRLPSPVPAKGAHRTRLGNLLAPEVRLPVRESRMTKVSYDVLRAEGLIPDGTFQESEVRLYQRRFLPRLTEDDPDALPYLELEVPIHMVGDGGSFGSGDYFVFYGLELRDDTEFEADVGQGLETIPGAGDPQGLDNEFNWYWLALSEPEAGEGWARMATESLPAASGTPLANYRRTDHHEDQVSFRQNVPTVSEDRIWANHYRDSEATVGLGPLWSPDPSGQEAVLQVVLAGYNAGVRSLRLDLEIDGRDSEILEYVGINSDRTRTQSYFLTADRIQGTGGLVRMREAAASGARMYAYLNYAELSYDALYHTALDRLQFHAGDTEGARPIEVTGFSNSDLGLIELTDPRHPVFVALAAANVVADGNDWKLSIEPVQTAEQGRRTFYAAADWSTDGVQDWIFFESEIVADSSDPRVYSAGQPDVIVVTHSEFRQPLERWVEHRNRRSRGEYRLHVVNVEDLYDMYSGGLRSAWAIKRFTEHAIDQWGSWALVIVGDANENARELQVQAGARAFSKDWVPTHYHVQVTSEDEPELMATDKWYVTQEYGADYPYDDFPDDVRMPWEMLQGRLPCNSAAELNAMIDKIIAVESPQANQEWRRRGIFMADDAWSNGYGADALSHLVYRSNELAFTRSERDSLATAWEFGAPVSLPIDTLFLDNYLDPYGDGTTTQPRELDAFRGYAENEATPALLSALNRGGLVAHYQGHGNAYVLATEYWLVDRIVYGRRDVGSISNVDKPWVFFGLGCHISDWAQNTVISSTSLGEQSLGEKFLVKGNAGASATLGSSGFEYITHNRVYSEYIFRRWMQYPPGAEFSPHRAPAGRSRWMLGEILWAADAELISRRGNEWNYPEMLSQYQLLGDPLMVMDGGEPEISATLLGESDQELTGESIRLTALDDTNLRVVTVHAADEAGIDRLVAYDLSDGVDRADTWATWALPDGAATYQVVDYRLELPIRPYRHSIMLEVYDTGAPLETDRHWDLRLDVPMDAVFEVEGAEIDTTSFEFVAGEPVHLKGTVSSGAWLDAGMSLALESGNLTLSNVLFEMAKSNEVVVYFTAVAEDDEDISRSVDLLVDGLRTPLTIESVDPTQPSSGVERVYNYPNPMIDGTSFVFEAAAGAEGGRIRVFSVSGRQVLNLDVRPGHRKGGERWCVPWNGRDAQGDRLANGTYLYRIEMQLPDGAADSDMQRLVVMK